MPAAFRCRLSELSGIADEQIIGRLSLAQSAFTSTYGSKTHSWLAELVVLRQAAIHLMAALPESRDWSVVMEYEIPLRNRWPDVVIIACDTLFVLEFKVGERQFRSADLWQVRSYALDLKDFHAASHTARIVPILIATEADDPEVQADIPFVGEVAPVAVVQCANARTLGETIRFLYTLAEHDSARCIAPDAWEQASYRPTPTIIEAAERLFRNQTVADISHHYATNLTATTDVIVNAIQASQRDCVRTVCFVTGVPGAGKTLTGLNAVHDPRVRKNDRPTAMFLSGNGPLVKIIAEALTRDRQAAGMNRRDASHRVQAFIANVHRFLSHYAVEYPGNVPQQHAIIFDEAQRAWSAEEVHKKHKIRKSEPELILDVMTRTPEWCTVVALIGGGQEINRGEAGLEEWGRALASRNEPWRVMIAPHLVDATDASLAGHRLFTTPRPAHITVVPETSLHLSVSVRSHRAKMIGNWVNALLSGETSTDEPGAGDFPVVMTRDLQKARAWLRDRMEALPDGKVARRVGLLASSGGLRLRAHGIEVSSGFRQGYEYADWFLNNADDIRSSVALEVAATEFECQGLELDWTGVCWGGDMAIDAVSGRWAFQKLTGEAWQKVRQLGNQAYIRNKYRVLLTRARRGMIIWVPEGDSSDLTRDPQRMDATAAYLRNAGIPDL